MMMMMMSIQNNLSSWCLMPQCFGDDDDWSARSGSSNSNDKSVTSTQISPWPCSLSMSGSVSCRVAQSSFTLSSHLFMGLPVPSVWPYSMAWTYLLESLPVWWPKYVRRLRRNTSTMSNNDTIIKVHTLDIAPLRSVSPPQKRPGMASVLKGFHSFTCTPTRSSAIRMSHTCLCLPSRSWYSFTDPGGMEGWVYLGAK